MLGAVSERCPRSRKTKERQMPHYFFHLIHPDRAPVRDEEGLIFEDDILAKREGLASLGDFVRDTTRYQSQPCYVSVQIVRAGVGIIGVLTAKVS